MNNEASVCTIFKNSLLLSNEVMHKIPDPSSNYSSTTQRPFDMFGSWQGKPLYVECKFMNKMQSFNLQTIQDHQIDNLCNFKKRILNAESWIVLGVHAGRGDNRIYVFKDIFEIEERRKAKENYKMKDLLTFSFLPVKKDLCQLNLLLI
jgi:penicillin-binding protein-related factor A (putative recombinase)